MIRKTPTLADLRQARDAALGRTIAGFHTAEDRMKGLDQDLAGFARERPIIALCGAAVLGAATGLLLSGRPVRNIAKATGLLILGPLVGDFMERVVRLASGETAEPEGSIPNTADK